MNNKLIVAFILIIFIVPTCLSNQNPKNNMSNKNKLTLIQEAIREHNAQWTAGYNSVFLSNGVNEQYFRGCKKDVMSDIDYISIEVSDDLPYSFDWRDVNGRNFITRVKTQGPCASCASFGTIGALEAVVQIEYNETFDCDLSEAHLFFCGGGSCYSGFGEIKAADFVMNTGVVDEQCFPYKAVNMDCNEKASNWRQRLVTISGNGYIKGVDAMKQALITYGPLVTTIKKYEDYDAYTGGIYEHVWGNFTGWYHCDTVIGYNDDPGYWIVKETAGPKWGENGYSRIKYGEIEIDDGARYYDGIGGNIHPYKPRDITPSNQASSIELNPMLSWECGDADGDIVSYSIYFNQGTSTDMDEEPIAYELNNKFYQIEDLEIATKYSFRILAEDEHGSQHISDEVSFTTRSLLPPNIDGPTKVKKNRKCTYTASTSERDGEVYFWFFDWGNGDNSGWRGPYGPDDMVTASHKWQEEGNYTIKVRYNQDGLISEWATLEVSMPKSKAKSSHLLTWLNQQRIDKFPFLEILL